MDLPQAKDESESEEKHPRHRSQRRHRNRWPQLTSASSAHSQAVEAAREKPKQTWAEELDTESQTGFELLFSSLIANVGLQLLEQQDGTTSTAQKLINAVQQEADAHIEQEEEEMWDTQSGVNSLSEQLEEFLGQASNQFVGVVAGGTNCNLSGATSDNATKTALEGSNNESRLIAQARNNEREQV